MSKIAEVRTVRDRLQGVPTAKRLVVFPQRRRPFLARFDVRRAAANR